MIQIIFIINILFDLDTYCDLNWTISREYRLSFNSMYTITYIQLIIHKKKNNRIKITAFDSSIIINYNNNDEKFK